MQKSTISMVIFNSYVCLPEGNGKIIKWGISIWISWDFLPLFATHQAASGTQTWSNMGTALSFPSSNSWALKLRLVGWGQGWICGTPIPNSKARSISKVPYLLYVDIYEVLTFDPHPYPDASAEFNNPNWHILRGPWGSCGLHSTCAIHIPSWRLSNGEKPGAHWGPDPLQFVVRLRRSKQSLEKGLRWFQSQHITTAKLPVGAYHLHQRPLGLWLQSIDLEIGLGGLARRKTEVWDACFSPSDFSLTWRDRFW